MIRSIAKEYTRSPGGRYIREGEYSGEHFRQELLKPWYLESKDLGEELTVDLDGGFGYSRSFLEEAFGGLVRDLKDPAILTIRIKSDDEPSLILQVHNNIKEALEREV